MNNGFGCRPDDLHIYVVRIKNKTVEVIERYEQAEGEYCDLNTDTLKCVLPLYRFNLIKDAVKNEFNIILEKEHMSKGKFSRTETPIERLFGKELLLLLWGIEDVCDEDIQTAILNWKGFMREERWWLYTMTNAATGRVKDRFGWRKALRYILSENPTS